MEERVKTLLEMAFLYKKLKCLPNYRSSDYSKFKACADDKINVSEN